MIKKNQQYSNIISSLVKRAIKCWRNKGSFELLLAIYRKLYRTILCRYPDLYVPRHRLLWLLFSDYFTDANPMKILWVEPDQITYIVEENSCPSELGRVLGGDWDQNCDRFEDTKFYQSIKLRICKNVDWENTPLYCNLLDPPEDVIWNRKCDSVTELRERMASIDALVENLKKNGYCTQKELLARDPHKTEEMNNDAVHPSFNEIRVAIGRDGELLMRRRGLHRLAIAKIIGLDTVAVQVGVRHSDWQKIRDKIRQHGSRILEEKLRSHPDVKDIT